MVRWLLGGNWIGMELTTVEIYTGITRGRKLVAMVGTKKALAIAVKNNKTQMRYTRLKTRLRTSV
jgi:ATP-dependent exoDNAse (exonuclease V) alpha subunit